MVALGMKLVSARVWRFRTIKPSRNGAGKNGFPQTTTDTLPHRQPPPGEKIADGSLTGGHHPSGGIRRFFWARANGPSFTGWRSGKHQARRGEGCRIS